MQQFQLNAVSTAHEPDCVDRHHQLSRRVVSQPVGTGVNQSVCYRLIGRSDHPLVLVLGGISASRKAFCLTTEGGDGWWQTMIGPGRAIDTDHYQVMAVDYSTSPYLIRRNAAALEKPVVTTLTQARLIQALLVDLQIKQPYTVIGASYGGLVALQLCHLRQFKQALVIGAAHEPWPQATAWRHVQRRIIQLGLDQENCHEYLAIARQLGIVSYRSAAEFQQRFTTQQGNDCISYLQHCGRRFAEHFDPHRYLQLSLAIDHHRIDPGQISSRIDLLGFNSDQIVPPEQIRQLHQQLINPGQLTLAETLYGHDGFLKQTDAVTDCIHQHLENAL